MFNNSITSYGEDWDWDWEWVYAKPYRVYIGKKISTLHVFRFDQTKYSQADNEDEGKKEEEET